MKKALKISFALNLLLLGGLIYVLNDRRKVTIVQEPAPAATVTEAEVIAPAPPPVESRTEPAPFRWSQLVSKRDYRSFIANLRAAGCPEPTIEDIVRGDTERAFAYERNQLRLDGSGDGPWSRWREQELIASLLSGLPANNQATPNSSLAGGTMKNVSNQALADSTSNTNQDSAASAYPLFLQNVNWGSLGFNDSQQAAIAEVRQQFQNASGGLNDNSGGASANQNADNSNPVKRWQRALQDADNQLRAELGAQGYAAYEQQQYYAWYQPQVAAAAGNGNLDINPDAFSPK